MLQLRLLAPSEAALVHCHHEHDLVLGLGSEPAETHLKLKPQL